MVQTVQGRGVVHYGTWATRPTAGIPVGSKMVGTDIGVGGYSEFRWDGTYWIPVCGELAVFNKVASVVGGVVVPISSVTGTLAQTEFAGSLCTLPVGLVTPNTELYVQSWFQTEAALIAQATIRSALAFDATSAFAANFTSSSLNITLGGQRGGNLAAVYTARNGERPGFKAGWLTETGAFTAAQYQVGGTLVADYTLPCQIAAAVTLGNVGDTMHLIKQSVKLRHET